MSITMSPFVTVKDFYIDGYTLEFNLEDIIAKKVRSISHPKVNRYPYSYTLGPNCPLGQLLISENLCKDPGEKGYIDDVQCYEVVVRFDNYGGSQDTNSNKQIFRFFQKSEADLFRAEMLAAVPMVE